DIGKNNTVQFVQPDSSSVALNRVTGASGSQIMGTLKANGQVFILNPNGVLFGKDARVNVGGLVASTKNISTADFMKGQYTLSGNGNPGAQVVNQGSLTTAKGGYIVLAGERVSNSGTVTTPSGKTVLAAGKTVTLQLDNGGLTSVSVNGSVVNALVENRGLISATNGQVYLTAKGQDMLLNTVVNNSGTVEAKGLASRGGEIVLSGGDSGVVSQSGHLLADSQTGQGGKITLEGQNIHLAGGSLTSATGKAGGGEVYVGGGWQGKDSRIRNASKVVMDKTATVDVSATDAGNGGTAVLWSDDYTNFRGTVLAKGGALSGNGGRVETSSHRNLQAYGEVDASARAGRGGDWLLDPTDVTIVGSGVDTGIGSATADGTDIFTPTASGAQILNSSIVNQLNAGTNVTVKTSGTETEGQTGNIRVNANIVKTAGADAKLTLLADNNIATADRVSIGATTGKLNLDLLAGNTTNNASITVGKFINISLNGGDFLAGAANPDNAVSLTYSNNGQIHGGNVTLNLTLGLSGYAYKVQADDDLTINGPVNGNTGWSVPLSFIAGGKLEMNSPTSISLNAVETTNGGGKVVISGDKGVTLNAANGTVLLKAATAATNVVNITSSNGVVSISGMAQKKGSNGLTLTNANITANNGITLNGTTETGTGVSVTGSNLSAPSLGVNGVASVSGTGFSLATSHLSGSLTNLVNVSLSSAGSGAGVINVLDSGIVNDANRDTLLAKKIDNMTTVDMAGNAIFDDSAKADKGWMQDYSSVDTPNGGWIFNNTSVTAGSDVNLKGAGFTNSTITVTNGSLTLDNGGPALLTGTTLTVSDGAVKVHAGAGNIDLSKGNISAKGDITLKADGGSIAISGTNTTVKAHITSAEGNISAEAYNPSTGSVTGVSVNNAQLNAEQGSININGTTPGTRSGVRLANADLKANAGTGSIKVYAESKGGQDTYDEKGSLYFGGTDTFTAKNIDITSRNLKNSYNGAGIAFDGGTALFNGNTSIKAFGYGVGIELWNQVHLGFANGNALLKGQTTGPGGSDKYYRTGAIAGAGIYQSSKIYVNLTHSNLNIDADSSSSAYGTVPAFGIVNPASEGYKINGFIFQGDGNVNISGVSTDGNAVDARLFDNTALTGNVVITGTSKSGTGVYLGGQLNTTLVNAQITGISESGSGVTLAAKSGTTSLGNNSISGTSETGSGIQLTGNNITLTSGTLTGTATSGNGSGVVLTGGSNYILDGVLVSGFAVDGSGISVNGTLTVNNGTTVEGHATGSGNGVTVSGNLATDSGDGISITGTAFSGDGIKVNGDTTLTNAVLSGNAGSGTGVNIAGNLTTDSATQVSGHAASGTGVRLGAVLTGASVKGSSDTGTGLQLADNAVVTEAVLNGTSISGDGVAVSGKVTLDDASAGALNASSTSGTGLKLTDNANVSIVSITTVTQEKKGPDGNTVTDAAGNPVMETITMTTPVTTPVTLTGISQSGSGVATSGNVSISGVILNGSSTSAGGSGATLGGNLTIADDISGITVNATGNGTGLVMDNVAVNADDYTSTGKNFVINASTSDIGGTAIRTQGNNQLTGVTLNGSAGNGGTAVVLGGQVSGASVTGTSDSGTAVRVSDARLTNTVVTGNATGNGTGVALSGAVSLDKTTAEALNAVSSGGTGLSLEQSANVSVAGLDAVSTAELKGLSQSGSGITTAGNVAIRGIVLNGSASTDSGVGVTLGGNLTIGDDVSRVTAGTTGSGTALVIDNATLQANGYAGTNKGPVILADASGAGGTAVKIQGDNQLNDVAIVGNASPDGGTGVLLGGQVTGANILGTAGSGTGVVVTDGTLMDCGTVKGRSHNGTGLAAGGNVTLNHALISGEAQGDGGTGVSLNGSITGGTVNGTSTSGDAVRIKDARLTGTEVNGVSQSGAGIKTQGNVTLSGVDLSAASENGKAALDVSGTLNHDQNTVMRADRVVGQENIHELQPDTPPSPGEGGATGSGGNTTPDTGDSGGVAGSDTGSGESGETVTPPPGGNGGDAGNNGNTGSATGGEGSLTENNVALRGEVPGAAIREQMTGQMFVSALHRQAVNAQVTRMNQAAQDGFHSAATPVVPVTGYQAKPQNVEISLCDGDSCQPESLDAARPAEGVVTSSGK
ncbi:filamentous hemagglutinin N-terminal domain-containing protein, partial [Salmonella enterica subsp. enterica]|nr:filamentous hemagglutinin N-terminal domain-containing protein [Salmonella enterica subsp. enterica]